MQLNFNSDPFHRMAETLSKRDLIPPEEYANFVSSLRKYILCNHCLRKFRVKSTLITHLKSCKSAQSITCEICNIKFTNKGNLAHHASVVHNNKKYNRIGSTFPCSVCHRIFTDNWKLMRHVRSTYFNLSNELCTHESKSINDVWVEKVVNSNTLMQMKKVKKNVIVMKKCDSPKAGVIEEPGVYLRKDFSKMLLQINTQTAACQFCNKVMMKKSLGKHINERHWNTKSHLCNKCGIRCNRPYQLLKHVCGTTRGRKRVKKIDNVSGVLKMEQNT